MSQALKKWGYFVEFNSGWTKASGQSLSSWEGTAAAVRWYPRGTLALHTRSCVLSPG
ncbi:hypothetical protein [Streptomyces sp. AK02-04a]|uniref:hypothetical protein n=1 Tax=Streptomyces sp. AK02-04a TaxID=3028649 RepID=UPI0029B88F24|nr:hypothetical protein [Streptomyces sp. AK02-04a]MDX3763867.1 hypothetical protein [Streptomyces sp. AK02-04a]